MPLKDKRNATWDKEQGFTLIEVLAAIVILSIVSLVLTSYFTQALSYSKSNQNKTIMVNLARNALFYMEKQDFEMMSLYFQGQAAEGTQPEIAGHSIIQASGCVPLTETTVSCEIYKDMVTDEYTLANVLNPVINNVKYQVKITYQAELHREMVKGKISGNTDDTIDERKKEMAPFLIPVEVKVTGPGGPNGHVSSTVVEGYITDEKIR
ncbi:type IV pilus modification PilV family protein [Paenibacillus wynnii]|uniref:type IV pilus modification PilV family protein n=1 Tax=Paenibacillus wynnii TaxID=268407 RepID=UPI00278FFD2A|nr:type II secretion system protein [Paenibacillus wynnii]MDQ0192160.1 prepilin-type N-terminal cleavage/methylation domain-containing protein [Paenibacillus wynnii]